MFKLQTSIDKNIKKAISMKSFNFGNSMIKKDTKSVQYSKSNILLRKNMPKQLRNYKIKTVGTHGLQDYGGMNYYAAKHLGFKPVPKKNEIVIEKDNEKFMKSTIIHEITEADLMKKGMNYKQAHKKAIKAEIDAGFVSKHILIETNKRLQDDDQSLNKTFHLNDGKKVIVKSKKLPVSKRLLNKVYSKIPDDKNIPLVFESKKQYLRKYVNNQEKKHNVDFPVKQEKNYFNRELKDMKGVVSRYTTKENKYAKPQTVFFTDRKWTPKEFKASAVHETAHEIWERNPKARKQWKHVYKNTSPTGYGSTDRQEDFAESYMLFKTGKLKDPKRLKILKDVMSKNRKTFVNNMRPRETRDTSTNNDFLKWKYKHDEDVEKLLENPPGITSPPWGIIKEKARQREEEEIEQQNIINEANKQFPVDTEEDDGWIKYDTKGNRLNRKFWIRKDKSIVRDSTSNDDRYHIPHWLLKQVKNEEQRKEIEKELVEQDAHAGVIAEQYGFQSPFKGLQRRPQIFFTNEQLLQSLKDKEKELGREPTGTDIIADTSIPSPSVYAKRFGNFINAKKMAGIKTEQKSNIYVPVQTKVKILGYLPDKEEAATGYIYVPEIKKRRQEIRDPSTYKKRVKDYQQEYYQQPENIQHRKEYRQEYYQQPENIQHRKDYEEEYYKQPEVKQRTRLRSQTPAYKEVQKEYREQPEIKEKRRLYSKEHRKQPGHYEKKKESYYRQKQKEQFIESEVDDVVQAEVNQQYEDAVIPLVDNTPIIKQDEESKNDFSLEAGVPIVDYPKSYGYKRKLVHMSPDDYMKSSWLTHGGKKTRTPTVEEYEKDAVTGHRYPEEGISTKVRQKYAESEEERLTSIKAGLHLKEDVVPTPWLETKKGVLYDQEGRHRAVAAREMGYKKIPVYVVETDKGFIKDNDTPLIKQDTMSKDNIIQSLFYAGVGPPSEYLRQYGKVYGFSQLRFAQAWARKFNYPYIYQYATDIYTMDKQRYIRDTATGKEYNDNEYIARNVLSEQLLDI